MCRQEQFVDICNLITDNVELQHAYRTHTWGPVSIKADPVSETVGAVSYTHLTLPTIYSV